MHCCLSYVNLTNLNLSNLNLANLNLAYVNLTNFDSINLSLPNPLEKLYSLFCTVIKRGYMKEIKSILTAECQWEQTLLVKYQKELEKLPKGTLCKKHRNNKVYYYHQYRTNTGGFEQKLIKQNQYFLVEQVKRRRFLEESIKSISNNIRLLDTFIAKFQAYSPDDISSKMAGTYKDLPLICYSDSYSKDVKNWIHEQFETTDKYPEHKIHQTSKGEMVRSKSEALIACMLDAYKVPYRYEAVLQLGQVKFFPDFTILRPRDNKIIYWEHFGLMDDPEYIKKTLTKLLLFREQGLRIGEDIIITFDSADGGIDVKELQDIIKIKLL